MTSAWYWLGVGFPSEWSLMKVDEDIDTGKMGDRWVRSRDGRFQMNVRVLRYVLIDISFTWPRNWVTRGFAMVLHVQDEITFSVWLLPTSFPSMAFTLIGDVVRSVSSSFFSPFFKWKSPCGILRSTKISVTSRHCLVCFIRTNFYDVDLSLRGRTAMQVGKWGFSRRLGRNTSCIDHLRRVFKVIKRTALACLGAREPIFWITLYATECMYDTAGPLPTSTWRYCGQLISRTHLDRVAIINRLLALYSPVLNSNQTCLLAPFLKSQCILVKIQVSLSTLSRLYFQPVSRSENLPSTLV